MTEHRSHRFRSHPLHGIPFRRLGAAAVAFATALLVAAGLPLTASAGDSGRPPTVVELFTSQGCNSCPPADALLGELATQPDLITLTYNVDYWDYLGWRDTLADPHNTRRQQEYAGLMGRRGVYTPQMVIGGHLDAVGSNHRAVANAIDRDRKRQDTTLDVHLVDKGDMVLVQITGAAYANEATILLVSYAKRKDVAIERGENAGKHQSYFNVVRDFKSLGLWRGHAMEIALGRNELEKHGASGYAVLVQLNGKGTIVGAQRMNLDGTS
jgi:hypothetical protein